MDRKEYLAAAARSRWLLAISLVLGFTVLPAAVGLFAGAFRVEPRALRILLVGTCFAVWIYLTGGIIKRYLTPRCPICQVPLPPFIFERIGKCGKCGSQLFEPVPEDKRRALRVVFIWSVSAAVSAFLYLIWAKQHGLVPERTGWVILIAPVVFLLFPLQMVTFEWIERMEKDKNRK